MNKQLLIDIRIELKFTIYSALLVVYEVAWESNNVTARERHCLRHWLRYFEHPGFVSLDFENGALLHIDLCWVIGI